MQIWRTTLVANDPDRNWFAAWARLGLPEPPRFTLADSSGRDVRLTVQRLRPSTWIDARLCCAFSIPNDTPAGEYTLRVAGVPTAGIRVVPTGSPAAPVVITDQVFRNRQLEVNAPSTLYRGCLFDRTSVFASGGLFFDCEWKGLAVPGVGNTHSFSTWGTRGPLAIIGGRFDGTDRGPVLQIASEMQITEPLFLGLTLTGISHIDNGNELLCVEARRKDDGSLRFPHVHVVRPIVAGWRCYSNEGDVYIAAPTDDMLIQDVVIDRGSIVAYKDSVTGGMIAGCELRRGRIVLADSAGVKVERCALLDRRPTRGNRTYTERYFYEPKVDEVKAAIYNLPAGLTANGTDARGNAVKDCSFEPGATE